MNNSLLLGLGHFMLPIPRPVWQRQVAGTAAGNRTALGFMSDEHHRVRDFAVVELPRAGAPLPPELFAEKLSLPLARVVSILDELEHHMTFLFRNATGAVTWAYPVTVAPTPHRVTFSTGEQIHAA
jgi:hypothetical protein